MTLQRWCFCHCLCVNGNVNSVSLGSNLRKNFPYLCYLKFNIFKEQKYRQPHSSKAHAVAMKENASNVVFTHTAEVQWD